MRREDIEARRDYHQAQAVRTRGEAHQLIQKAEEHEGKVRAYDLVLQDLPTMMDEMDESQGSGSAQGVDAGGGEASFMDLTRKAVAPQPDSFGLYEVKQTLSEIAPGALEAMSDRNALSKALSRMADGGEIFIIRKGQGKRPAVYSKTNPNLSPVSMGRFVGLMDQLQDSEADDHRPNGGGE